MPILEHIHRFPVKGFSPDALSNTPLTAGQALPFDRHWAIENGAGAFDDAAPAHVGKKNFLMLVGQPGLARLQTRFDAGTSRWSVSFPDGETMTIDPDNPLEHDGLMLRLADMFGPLVRGPLRLVRAPGQAMTDIPQPYPSIINLASIRDLGDRLGAALDPVRFRGNLLIDGLEPWRELDLVGQPLRIGSCTMTVEARIRRCVATSINPETAEQDQDIPRALFDAFGHMDCGVYVSVQSGGVISTGDPVDLS